MKFYIGINKEPVWVETAEEANSVLAQTVLKARESVKATLEQGGTMKAPHLAGPPEIRESVKQTQRMLNAIHRSGRVDQEIQQLMHREMDEEFLLFL